MKIIKIEIDKKNADLAVYTDAFPKLGFVFKVDNILNKADLKLKLKQRLIKEAARIQSETDRSDKFDQLRSLEGEGL